MNFNNRTILISGLVICSIIAMYFSYKDIALTIVAGLVGYLSKDVESVESVDVPVESGASQDIVSVESIDDSPKDDEGTA